MLDTFPYDFFAASGQVFAAEQKLIQEKIRAREATGWRGKRQRFSLAFSGGGIRAAAF
ncbi:unnamed protein product, partial [Effrenium voratum]